MKFTSILTCLFGVCAALLPVLAAPVELERRNVGSYIHGHATFYRAVTRGELAHIHNYQVGHHPASYAQAPGDFGYHGALYVFSDIREARLWGDSFTAVSPDGNKRWYLVEFSYSPQHGLSTHSFPAGTNDWKNFVNGNYAGHSAHIDIVEGPVSVGRQSSLQAATSPITGHDIHQVAFASPHALTSLVVTRVTTCTAPSKAPRWCSSCNIM